MIKIGSDKEAIEYFIEHAISSNTNDPINAIQVAGFEYVYGMIGPFGDEYLWLDMTFPEQWLNYWFIDFPSLSFASKRIDKNKQFFGSLQFLIMQYQVEFVMPFWYDFWILMFQSYAFGRPMVTTFMNIQNA